jgi:hypothetical protein
MHLVTDEKAAGNSRQQLLPLFRCIWAFHLRTFLILA